jgi:hypothetical protein
MGSEENQKMGIIIINNKSFDFKKKRNEGERRKGRERERK